MTQKPNNHLAKFLESLGCNTPLNDIRGVEITPGNVRVTRILIDEERNKPFVWGVDLDQTARYMRTGDIIGEVATRTRNYILDPSEDDVAA